MEDKIYKDDLEQFLKDTTDDFLMVPSGKVWFSIYNNIHPDRKWPSMAVCFLILSAVLYLGVSNNNSLSDAARRANIESLSGIAKNYSAIKKSASVDNAALNSKPISQYLYHDYKPGNNYLSDNQDQGLVQNVFNTESSVEGSYITTVNDEEALSTDIIPLKKEIPAFSSSRYNSDESVNSAVKNNAPLSVKLLKAKNKNTFEDNAKTASPDQEPALTLSETSINTLPAAAEKKSALKIAADNERSWKEDYAFRNKPLMNKFKERASITYFITPSVGYRYLSKVRETLVPPSPVGPVSSSSFIAPALAAALSNNQPIDDGKAVNLEVGAVLNYALSKNISIKAGIQGNYTNYTSKVIELGHPAQVQLAVNVPYNSTGSSTFSAVPGSDMLNRSSLQIAMPVGADFKVAGTKKIKWYVGTSVQPTYVFSGNSYILSADEKNYAAQSALIHKWNLNTAIETFISFKPSERVTFNVGPQFRYQLLSSFKNEYNYSEKLYNIGMKIGINTRF